MDAKLLRRQSAALAMSACLTLSSTAAQAVAAPKHLFVILMENHATEEIIGNAADAPFINGDLLKRAGVSYATQYFGVTHPSLPNYVAMISGEYYGIQDDNPSCFAQPPPGPPCDSINATNLIDNLESKSLTWNVLEESMPKAGWLGVQWPGSAPRLYAQKHNPYVYFADIASNQNRLARILPLNQTNLSALLANPPTYTMLVPNQCDDMHGTTTCSSLDPLLRRGDEYLKSLVSQIVSAPSFTASSVVFVAWDEDDYSSRLWCCSSKAGDGGGHTLAMVFSSTSGGKTAVTPFNHYSMLRTIEEGLGLPYLGHSGDSAVMPMWSLF